MSEQKVWVEKMPESCGDCEFCETSEHWFYCSRLGIKLKYISREKDCPLQSLKTHDRELVKEVCEKIKERAVNMYYAEDQEDDSIEQAIVISRNEAVDEFIDILDQIQKEAENE